MNKIDKVNQWSFLLAIVIIWVLVFSLDTTTWSNGAKLLVQTIIPMILTFVGITAFLNWGKICKELHKKEDDK